MKHTKNVQVEHYFPVLLGRLDKGHLGCGPPGIIDQDIYLAELFQGFFHHVFNFNNAGYIRLDSQRFSPHGSHLGSCFFGTGQVYIGSNNITAVFSQGQANPPAKTDLAPRPGNQCYLTVKLQVHHVIHFSFSCQNIFIVYILSHRPADTIYQYLL